MMNLRTGKFAVDLNYHFASWALGACSVTSNRWLCFCPASFCDRPADQLLADHRRSYALCSTFTAGLRSERYSVFF